MASFKEISNALEIISTALKVFAFVLVIFQGILLVIDTKKNMSNKKTQSCCSVFFCMWTFIFAYGIIKLYS